jgi:hypothetical protein
MESFDWAPYFQGYTPANLLTVSVYGLSPLFVLIAVRLGAEYALDFVGHIRRVIGA